jgi:hypothetical protein
MTPIKMQAFVNFLFKKYKIESKGGGPKIIIKHNSFSRKDLRRK